MLFRTTARCALILHDIAANAQADAVAALLNAGYLRLYDGTQPADADTPLTTQRLLAELRFGTPAFKPASEGLVVANAIGKGQATRTGLATWFRCLANDGTTTVIDGSIGTGTGDLDMDDAKIQRGGEVCVSNFAFEV